jgi:WD40 repeat protein
LHKFTKWSLNWDESGTFVNAKKSIKEIENEASPLIQESGSKSIWFVQSPTKQRPESKDGGARIADSTQYRVLVRVQDGFMVVNLNANREDRKIDFLTTHVGIPQYAISDDGRWLMMGDDSGLAYVWDTIEGDRYSVTIDPATEATIGSTDRKARAIPERPAHTGPIAGVALSQPDPGRDYPAFAATFGEENKVKVWELFPILDPEHGLRSKHTARYPVSRSVAPQPSGSDNGRMATNANP